MMISYKIIRSGRKTLALEVRDGELIVRAPYRMPERVIESFIKEKQEWIGRAIRRQEKQEKEASGEGVLSENEIRALSEEAARRLPEFVREYAPLVGVTYGKISIKLLKSRWGSCSAKGNLNFNCLLALAPEEVQRYVVVHELCHRKEMNHSRRFWAEVGKVLPDYRLREKWLKEHGGALMKKISWQ